MVGLLWALYSQVLFIVWLHQPVCWVYFLHHCYKVAASTELILQPYSKSRTKDMSLSLKSGTLSRCLLAPEDFLLDNDALKPVCSRRWKLIITFSRFFELIVKYHHPWNWLWWECLYTPWHMANATNQDIFPLGEWFTSTLLLLSITNQNKMIQPLLS